MRYVKTLLRSALAATVLAAGFATAQTVGSTITAGTTPTAIAINPITNKVYVTNDGSGNVTAIDGTSHVTETLPVGPRPLWIAANPETNKLVVGNFGSSNFQVIDGATHVVGAVQNSGGVGWMTVNPATNTFYQIRFGTGDEVNVIQNNVYQHTSATRSHQPVSIVVNPVTNVLYVAHQLTGDVVAFDAGTFLPGGYPGGSEFYPKRLCPDGSGGYTASPGQFDPAPPVCIDVADPVVALTVNPVTNLVYAVSSSATGQISVIRGHGMSNPHTFTSYTPPGVTGAAKAIAVNPVTNKVYAAFANHVVVFNGATNAMTVIDAGAVAIGVNMTTNRIYAPDAAGNLRVIDGDTNSVINTVSIPTGARSIAVNPLTNKVFIVTASGVVPVTGAADAEQPVPLTVAIQPLAENTSGPSGSLTISASASAGMPAPRRVYFQVDGGAWTAATGSGPYTASFTGLSNGSHTVRAFATNGLEAPSIMTDVQNNPLLGAVSSYTFTVADSSPVDPSVSLASSKNPSAAGTAVTFTASVSGSSGTATGTVNFLNGASSISGCSAVALSGGSAACTTSSLPVGTHSISAAYSGNDAYNPKTSSTLSQTVANPGTPSITLGSTANPSTVGQYVTYTAVVSGASGTPTGTIVFRDNGNVIPGCGGLVMANGRASCTIGNQALGTHSMTAVYSGDSLYTGITSSTLPQVVNAAKANTPSITLGSSVNPSTVGQYVELTAVVFGGAGTPTGTLVFLDNGDVISGCGGLPMTNGRATCTPGGLTLGTHSITVVYSGDGTYNGVTSSTLPQTVNAAKAHTPSLTLGSSQNPSVAGNVVTFTAVLSGPAGTVTGNVVFRNNGQMISGCGGLALVNGRVSCSPRFNTPGTYSITAIYQGDGNYNGVTSSVVSQNVQ